MGQSLGFTEIQVGRVAGNDLAGLAIGAVIAALFIAKVDRRLMVVIAAAIAIGANILCIYYQSYEATFWLRLVAGIGAGIYTGYCRCDDCGALEALLSHSAWNCSLSPPRRVRS